MSSDDIAVDLATLVAETGAAAVERYESSGRVALVFPVGAGTKVYSTDVPGDIANVESGRLNGLPDDFHGERALRITLDLDE